jgi:hypothetical protein
MTMKHPGWIMLVTLSAFAPAAAQLPKGEAKEIVLKGYVVDAMCGEAWAKKGNGEERAAKHSKACALNDHCSASGYGVFSAGRWMKFDARGDRKAKVAIEKSVKERGHYFEIHGVADGKMLQVASLSEIIEKK